jgi:hypothetical protein
MPMLPAMGAPPPTGVLPPCEDVSPPFGGGGVWAEEKLIVNSAIVNSVAKVFVNVFLIFRMQYF